MLAAPNRSPPMKSVPILLFFAAALGVFVSAQGMQATKTDVLVASAMSPHTWTRVCTYAGAAGVQRVEVDAAAICPNARPEGAQRHARLDR